MSYGSLTDWAHWAGCGARATIILLFGGLSHASVAEQAYFVLQLSKLLSWVINLQGLPYFSYLQSPSGDGMSCQDYHLPA